MQRNAVIPRERIARAILLVRGTRVLVDSDLAELYGVETKTLVRQIKRNAERFPEDFMFQLTREEFEELRTHAESEVTWGGRRYPPYVFTEQGVAMLSSVLRSRRASQVNVEIMRVFVRLREILVTHEALAHRVDDLERRYDGRFKAVFEAIRELMHPSDPEVGRRIGFRHLSHHNVERPSSDRGLERGRTKKSLTSR